MTVRTIISRLIRSELSAVQTEEAITRGFRSYDLSRTGFIVNAQKGTNYRFTKYGDAGNSPHQHASEVYLRSGSADDVAQVFRDFLILQKPANLKDLLFPSSTASELDELARYSPLDKFQPWRPAVAKTPGYLGQRDASFQEINEAYVRTEAIKQIAAVDSLRSKGYRPQNYRRGYLRGSILLANGDYRFLVEDGKHRLGALNALRIKEITVCLNQDVPVVDERKVDAWPMVSSGQCSRELALALLHRHFA